MTEIALLFNIYTKEFKLPPGLLSSLCYIESKHNPNAINRKDGNGDSLGICQIKLRTARALGFKGTKEALMNLRTNIYYSGKYLRSQIPRYKSVKKGIVAYNLGHYTPNYKKYLKSVMKAYRNRR